MNPLYLSGFGVSLSVDRARLIVRDGFVEPDSERIVHELQPRDARYDSVTVRLRRIKTRETSVTVRSETAS